MKALVTLSLACLSIASCATAAFGQTAVATPAAGTDCPAAADVGALHLYGSWQARWDGTAEVATLTLGRSPEHPDGVRGRVRHGTTEALVAGDVDDGDFTLEESADGRAIIATWTGKVVDGSCGKEIRGIWNNAAGNAERGFVLRKLSGW